MTHNNQLSLVDHQAIGQYAASLAETTNQWVAWAAQQVLEGNTEAALEGLAAINGQIAEFNKHVFATTVVLAAVQESYQAAIAQRDGLAEELAYLQANIDAEVGEQVQMELDYLTTNAPYLEDVRFDDMVERMADEGFEAVAAQERAELENKLAQAREFIAYEEDYSPDGDTDLDNSEGDES